MWRSGLRSSIAHSTRVERRPAGKIRWPWRLKEKVAANRLDWQGSDLPYQHERNFIRQFACPGARNYGAEKDGLSVTASAFPSQCCPMHSSRPRVPNTHIPARFRGKEAA